MHALRHFQSSSSNPTELSHRHLEKQQQHLTNDKLSLSQTHFIVVLGRGGGLLDDPLENVENLLLVGSCVRETDCAMASAVPSKFLGTENGSSAPNAQA